MKAFALAFALLAATAWPARAADLRLEFHDGFVTLSARDMPVRQILAEWARRGQTRILNGERVMDGPVTLELTHVPEQQALEVLLHSVAGYVAAPRQVALAGASAFDRIIVMPTSVAAPTSASRPQPGMGGFQRPPMMTQPQITAMPQPDDQDEPVMPGGVEQPFVPTDPNAQAPAQAPGQAPIFVPGVVPPQVMPDTSGGASTTSATPAVPGPTPLQQGVVTSPTPGIIPIPQQNQKPQ